MQRRALNFGRFEVTGAGKSPSPEMLLFIIFYEPGRHAKCGECEMKARPSNDAAIFHLAP